MHTPGDIHTTPLTQASSAFVKQINIRLSEQTVSGALASALKLQVAIPLSLPQWGLRVKVPVGTSIPAGHARDVHGSNDRSMPYQLLQNSSSHAPASSQWLRRKGLLSGLHAE